MQDVKIERHRPDPRWVCVTQTRTKSLPINGWDGRSKMDIIIQDVEDTAQEFCDKSGRS